MNESSKWYIINGDPIPLARARHTIGRVYDSQKALKLIWGISLAQQHENLPTFRGPLLLEVNFYMTIPKRSSNKLNSIRYKPHIYVPDLDNLIKWCCDVSAGILYDNDCIIASIIANKMYDLNPRTEFRIKKL